MAPACSCHRAISSSHNFTKVLPPSAVCRFPFSAHFSGKRPRFFGKIPVWSTCSTNINVIKLDLWRKNGKKLKFFTFFCYHFTSQISINSFLSFSTLQLPEHVPPFFWSSAARAQVFARIRIFSLAMLSVSSLQGTVVFTICINFIFSRGSTLSDK